MIKNIIVDNSIEREIMSKELVLKAIKNNNVFIEVQPIIDNKTDEVSKHEVLMRIRDKNGFTHYPDSFLPCARGNGLYFKLTEIMVLKAFEMFKDGGEFSVNISMEDILDERTNLFLIETFQNRDISRNCTIELVEVIDIECYLKFNKFLEEIDSFGVKVALDDFGKGYSNFMHLSCSKFDYIKIDGHFVKNIDCIKNYKIIEIIIFIAKTFGMKIIAEFIEDKEIYERVSDLGIDYSQGYYFGKPAIEPIENY